MQFYPLLRSLAPKGSPLNEITALRSRESVIVSFSVIQEATALQFEILYEQFTNDGKDSSDESLQVALLADLQQRQELEADHVLTSMIEKVRILAV